MDRMTSAAFRVTLMDLRRPVEVTVHGRVIGTWTPAGVDEVRPKVEVKTQDEPLFRAEPRTFTPAPKPTSRR